MSADQRFKGQIERIGNAYDTEKRRADHASAEVNRLKSTVESLEKGGDPLASENAENVGAESVLRATFLRLGLNYDSL